MDEQVEIGKIRKIDDWQLKVLDESRLPDVEAVETEHVNRSMEEHSQWKLIGAGIGLVLGLVIGFFAQGVIAAAAGAVIGGLLGFVIAHFIIKSRGIKEAQRELMPQIAELCGGRWAEDAREIVPPGNPLAERGDFNSFDTDVRHQYGDGITGTLPGHGVGYGIFNYTIITERRVEDSEGNERTDRDTDNFVVSWIDLAMPVQSLEVKRRWLKGGGFLGRMMDKVDSRVSDQNVLEMESEEFNRMYKVEVADNADGILVRRMFSPKVMDAFVQKRVDLQDDIQYRNGRVWIVDGRLDCFNARTAAKTLDYMVYRAQLVAKVCDALAKEVGQTITQRPYQ